MLLKHTTPESLPNIFPVDLWDLREQRHPKFLADAAEYAEEAADGLGGSRCCTREYYDNY